MSDRMTYAEAIDRRPDRAVPSWWVGNHDALDEVLDSCVRGTRQELTRTPGDRPMEAITYGTCSAPRRAANYNSAVAAGEPERYVDREDRDRPVVLLIGPVHGDEVEGLTGLANLIRILETGEDGRGTSHPSLARMAADCRVVIVPIGNPDGLARFEPDALAGCTEADLRFWGQGTWADDTFMGWPAAKRLHPMTGDAVGFLGGYFNDDGINPMHDEFFAPMGPEAPALLDLTVREAPDVIVSLHSHPHPPAVLRPTFVPVTTQREVLAIAIEYEDRLRDRGLPVGPRFEPHGEAEVTKFNLVSALYHACGAVTFTHESPHGLEDGCQLSFDDLLDVQLTLYRSIVAHVTSGDPSTFKVDPTERSA